MSNKEFLPNGGGILGMQESKMRHLKDEQNYDFFMNLIKEYDEFILASETDLEGVITYVSKAFAKLTGYTREELIGQSHNILRDPKVPSIVFKNLWEKLQKDETVEIEFSSKKKDGDIYWIASKIYPIYENGQKIGYRSLKKDITSIKKLAILNKRLETATMELNITNEELSASNSELLHNKQSLELSNHELSTNMKNYDTLMENNTFLLKVTQTLNEDINKEKEKFVKFQQEMITIFTHELKTPLNAIINFSDYIYRNLQKQPLSEKKLKKLISLAQKINENGLVELNMVQNILEISKANSKKYTVKTTLMNIKHIIHSVIDRYIDAYNKEIELNLEDVEVDIDVQKFTMVFDNIFSNALKYSSSKVSITLSKSKNNFNLIVEDDGEGIKKEDRIKVFELFEQLDTDVLNREKSGTGVGLYTVKLLCDHVGCKISIDDSSLGGAKFIIEK